LPAYFFCGTVGLGLVSLRFAVTSFQKASRVAGTLKLRSWFVFLALIIALSAGMLAGLGIFLGFPSSAGVLRGTNGFFFFTSVGWAVFQILWLVFISFLIAILIIRGAIPMEKTHRKLITLTNVALIVWPLWTAILIGHAYTYVVISWYGVVAILLLSGVVGWGLVRSKLPAWLRFWRRLAIFCSVNELVFGLFALSLAAFRTTLAVDGSLLLIRYYVLGTAIFAIGWTTLVNARKAERSALNWPRALVPLAISLLLTGICAVWWVQCRHRIQEYEDWTAATLKLAKQSGGWAVAGFLGALPRIPAGIPLEPIPMGPVLSLGPEHVQFGMTIVSHNYLDSKVGLERFRANTERIWRYRDQLHPNQHLPNNIIFAPDIDSSWGEFVAWTSESKKLGYENFWILFKNPGEEKHLVPEASAIDSTLQRILTETVHYEIPIETWLMLDKVCALCPQTKGPIRSCSYCDAFENQEYRMRHLGASFGECFCTLDLDSVAQIMWEWLPLEWGVQAFEILLTEENELAKVISFKSTSTWRDFYTKFIERVRENGSKPVMLVAD